VFAPTRLGNTMPIYPDICQKLSIPLLALSVGSRARSNQPPLRNVFSYTGLTTPQNQRVSAALPASLVPISPNRGLRWTSWRQLPTILDGPCRAAIAIVFQLSDAMVCVSHVVRYFWRQRCAAFGARSRPSLSR
jgi:hypothetical protein